MLNKIISLEFNQRKKYGYELEHRALNVGIKTNVMLENTTASKQ